jgi:hypothetical protein
MEESFSVVQLSYAHYMANDTVDYLSRNPEWHLQCKANIICHDLPNLLLQLTKKLVLLNGL